MVEKQCLSDDFRVSEDSDDRSRSAACLREHREHPQCIDPVNASQDDGVDQVRVPRDTRLSGRRTLRVTASAVHPPEVHAEQSHTGQQRTEAFRQRRLFGRRRAANVVCFCVNHFRHRARCDLVTFVDHTRHAQNTSLHLSTECVLAYQW